MADEFLQFVPGIAPGTIRGRYDPDIVPEEPDFQGRVYLIPVDDEDSEPLSTKHACWPVVSSAELFTEYEQELADRPQKRRDVKKLGAKFVPAFPDVPSAWPPIREWLNATYQGITGRTKRNRFDSLNSLLTYAVSPLKVLPYNPLEGARRPDANSRKASPLSVELLSRLHELAMQKPVRDQSIWLCRFALGWRPVECRRLTVGDVRRAVTQEDGYISREQKYRSGKESRSPSPILPEVLDVLNRLAVSMPGLPDDAPIFYGTRGRHQGRPLGDDGIRGVIRKLFDEAGIREEVPDAIPYDLRDSFAAHVGRAVRARGGRTGEAKDVARRLLGHGDGGDVLSRYWDDDERHLELSEYTPLRLLYRGGTQAEPGGKLVELGGLEPPASSMPLKRSPR